jgi:hypothetical protein
VKLHPQPLDDGIVFNRQLQQHSEEIIAGRTFPNGSHIGTQFAAS